MMRFRLTTADGALEFNTQDSDVLASATPASEYLKTRTRIAINETVFLVIGKRRLVNAAAILTLEVVRWPDASPLATTPATEDEE